VLFQKNKSAGQLNTLANSVARHYDAGYKNSIEGAPMASNYAGHSHLFGDYRLLIQVAPHEAGTWRVWVGLGTEPQHFASREEAEDYAMQRADELRPCTLRIIRAWGMVERECEFPQS
jgi:hypothetical protein